MLAIANTALISANRRLVIGRNTSVFWLTTERTSLSQPEIFGNPSIIAGKAGSVGGKLSIFLGIVGGRRVEPKKPRD